VSDTTLALRRLSAVLFADIVAFTRLTAADDAGAMRVVHVLQECARSCLQRDGGRVVRFVGDSVLAEFKSAVSAVTCGLRFERAFAERSAGAGHPCMVRIGVHVGELTEGPDGDIYGESVNLAARVQAAASPRQLFVSEDVYRQLRSRGEFAFLSIGTRELKGIDRPVALYIAWDPAQGEPPGVTAPTTAGPVAAHQVSPGAPAGAPVQAAELGAPRATPAAPAATRLIVLPFRLLRPDPDIDFLSFGLADAITTSLGGIRSLVVRSSLAGMRYASQTPELRVIGRELDVDRVLTGTLLRAGQRVQVNAQLTDVEDGRVLWSGRHQVDLDDLFRLQEVLTERIVASVSTPLSPRERRLLRQDVPATARAFEFYLKANELSFRPESWHLARELYRAALAEDPDYAPAWARLGRIHRVIAKFAMDADVVAQELPLADEAFRRALEINPDLGLAHFYLAQHEVERGHPRDAMVRLLERARTAPDAEVYAGLVHALRYCGLLEQSLAAWHAARRLDPHVRTSVDYTRFTLGRYTEVKSQADVLSPGNLRDIATAMLGEFDEAIEGIRQHMHHRVGAGRAVADLLLEALEAHRDRRPAQRPLDAAPIFDQFPDAEGQYFVARILSFAGDHERALRRLQRAVTGYFCDHALRHDPWLAPLHAMPAYAALVSQAAEGRERALTSFIEAGGFELLEPAAAAA
jgi:class 3 adenylate cyclase/TolB-like protein